MKQEINTPLINQGRFPSGPTEPASGRFSSEPVNQAGGRLLSRPTRPNPVASNDSSGCFGSHAVVDFTREPIVRRRSSCFLYVLYLLGVMLATWFLYAVGSIVYFMVQVK
jgi:hypothetical protein